MEKVQPVKNPLCRAPQIGNFFNFDLSLTLDIERSKVQTSCNSVKNDGGDGLPAETRNLILNLIGGAHAGRRPPLVTN